MVARIDGNTFRCMMAKVIIIGSFISELVAMSIGTTYVGKILVFTLLICLKICDIRHIEITYDLTQFLD